MTYIYLLLFWLAVCGTACPHCVASCVYVVPWSSLQQAFSRVSESDDIGVVGSRPYTTMMLSNYFLLSQHSHTP